MSAELLLVRFRPSGASVHVPRGTKLTEAAILAGLALEQPCGGEGRCGKCKVLVHQGASPPTAAELAFFSEVELTHGWRLACQCRLENPLVVEVPATGGADDGRFPPITTVVVVPDQPRSRARRTPASTTAITITSTASSVTTSAAPAPPVVPVTMKMLWMNSASALSAGSRPKTRPEPRPC